MTLTHAQALDAAHVFMLDTYGVPRELDIEARTLWYERMGLLVHFLVVAFDETAPSTSTDNSSPR